jgi:multicomponent K+:H+ antiporter subunit F
MLTITLAVAAAALAGAVALNLWRLARGPFASDRILALDTLAINVIALVLLLGVAQGDDYFDAALLLAMMSFIGTAALCKFALSRTVFR